MRTITPSLWFDGNLEEAVAFYADLFPGSHVGEVLRGPDGEPVSASFTLAGREFNAINGGPEFPFTEAVSFVVPCESAEEVDRYWDALTADGGQESRCGWLKDRFGLSWQVVPVELYDMLRSSDAAAAARATEAMLGMDKLDLHALRTAFAG